MEHPRGAHQTLVLLFTLRGCFSICISGLGSVRVFSVSSYMLLLMAQRPLSWRCTGVCFLAGPVEWGKICFCRFLTLGGILKLSLLHLSFSTSKTKVIVP